MGLVSLFREQSGADSADSYSERPSQPRFVPVEGARMRSADAPRIGKEASRRSGYGGRAIVPPTFARSLHAEGHFSAEQSEAVACGSCRGSRSSPGMGTRLRIPGCGRFGLPVGAPLSRSAS